MTRKIIHIDMDCFYAAIEMRDYPELASKPIAVGGSPGKRGVISTCNYQARKFGVRSAMATAQALKLCPDLVIQPGRMHVYREESAYIREIFAEFTDKIEPLSLDEAYLDVTGSIHHQGSASWIAKAIRERINTTRQLTASAGIGPNKCLAKIASDWRKPNGQMLVAPAYVAKFMYRLPVRKLFGVGPVMEDRLALLGIKTCGDLQAMSKIQLAQQFGSMGERLYELARGIDNREVQSERIRKSISVEETYIIDLASFDACVQELPILIKRLEERIKNAGKISGIHNVFVKLKFNDFKQTTVECLAHAIDKDIVRDLLSEGWKRGEEKPVRLLGVGIRLAQEQAGDNMQLIFPCIDKSL